MPPERLKAEETPAGEVVAACEALSFAGLRLVLVEGADAWKAADAAPLVAYLEAPNAGQLPGAGIGRAADARAARRRGRSSAASCATGPTPRRSAASGSKWLVDHFRAEVARAGGSVSPALARTVVERVMVDTADARKAGLTAMDLAREAEKLAAYADGEPISAEMIAAIVPRPPRRQGLRAGRRHHERQRGPWCTTCCRTWPPATTRLPPIVMQVQLANRFRRARPGAGARAQPVARRRRRGDRHQGLPGPDPRRAGAGAAPGRRPAGPGADRRARAGPARVGAARLQALTR